MLLASFIQPLVLHIESMSFCEYPDPLPRTWKSQSIDVLQTQVAGTDEPMGADRKSVV